MSFFDKENKIFCQINRVHTQVDACMYASLRERERERNKKKNGYKYKY
jgi:hypothetical protein